MPDTIEEQSLIRIAYTTTEAAAKLGVNPATIYRLIARRQLRAVPAAGYTEKGPARRVIVLIGIR